VLGGNAITFPLDVSNPEALCRAADEVAERCGAIDIWINNAMVTMFSPISEMTFTEFRRITDVTYLGYVYGTMAALKHMRSRGSGTIIQIGSALSYRAIPLQSAYCGAKFAVRAFTDSLRSELRHEGSYIRLTMLQLPAVNTPQFDWARNRFHHRAQPLAPIFQPEAVAGIVYRAARTTPRELWIGFPVLKTIAGAIAGPGFLDGYLAKKGYEGQLAAERQPDSPIDNLFAPTAAGHTTRGRFSDRAKDTVFAINPARIRGFVAMVLCTFVAGVAFATALLASGH
jgi:NAD(P)-dependent dehydrogenase (short-subunit alcohol dehydrogenase family)